MKEKNRIKSNIVKCVRSVHVVDWILLLFMIILMTQTAYNLFHNELNGNSSPIDTVIRTSTAGLFGYFMGKGFSQKRSKNDTKLDNQKKHVPFEYALGDSGKTNNIQLVVVGLLGILSLMLLIITRNMNVATVEKIATISQLRDFILGSTGFLISNAQR